MAEKQAHAHVHHNEISSEDITDEAIAFALAERYGLQVKIIEGNWKKMCFRDYPSFARQNDGRFILVLRADNENFLIHDPQNRRTSIITKTSFLTEWSGISILFSKEEADL